MENRIDQLIQNLKTLDVDLKKRTIDELATLDGKPVETALHWAMNYDIDQEIRDYARAAYEKIHLRSVESTAGGTAGSEQEPGATAAGDLDQTPAGGTDSAIIHEQQKKQPQNKQPPGTARQPGEISLSYQNSKRKESDLNDTSHMAVLEEIEEEPRNIYGDTSLKLAALKIALYITLLFLEAPYDAGEILPTYVKIVEIAGIVTPFVGIIMAVAGLLSHLSRKFTSKLGLVFNGLFAFFWLIKLVGK